MSTEELNSIELHCHIDGCVRLETIEDLARRQKITLPGPVAAYATAPANCDNLVDYIRAIDIALLVLQTPEGLYRAAYELVETWASDGVLHGEARFAPDLHTREGLGHEEIVDAVSAGLTEGVAKFGVNASLILSCMRPADPATTWRIVDLAARHPGVVGIDVAGPEKGVSLLPHAGAFRAGKEEGLRVTVHAGEAAGPENVWHAIDELGAERIGHGIRSIADDRLLRRLAAEKILLEVCPTSNVQTRASASIGLHPIDRLRWAGVPVSVSTDARTVSGVSMRSEYQLLRDKHGWEIEDWDEAQWNALEAAFVSEEVRKELHHEFEAARAQRSPQ